MEKAETFRLHSTSAFCSMLSNCIMQYRPSQSAQRIHKIVYALPLLPVIMHIYHRAHYLIILPLRKLNGPRSLFDRQALHWDLMCPGSLTFTLTHCLPQSPWSEGFKHNWKHVTSRRKEKSDSPKLNLCWSVMTYFLELNGIQIRYFHHVPSWLNWHLLHLLLFHTSNDAQLKD